MTFLIPNHTYILAIQSQGTLTSKIYSLLFIPLIARARPSMISYQGLLAVYKRPVCSGTRAKLPLESPRILVVSLVKG